MRTHLNRKRLFRVRTCSQCPHSPREGGSSEINGVGLGLATPRRAPWRGPSCVRERGRHLPALTRVPQAGEIGGKMGGQARPCGHEGAAVTGTRRRRCHAKPAAPREKRETGTPPRRRHPMPPSLVRRNGRRLQNQGREVGTSEAAIQPDQASHFPRVGRARREGGADLRPQAVKAARPPAR